MGDKERLEEVKEAHWGNLKTTQTIHVKWLIERVQELESESYNAHLERLLGKREQQNKRYREKIKKLISEWGENVKSTEQHNKSDYSSYRTGLIEGLGFAIEELEEALEESE